MFPSREFTWDLDLQIVRWTYTFKVITALHWVSSRGPVPPDQQSPLPGKADNRAA